MSPQNVAAQNPLWEEADAGKGIRAEKTCIGDPK